MTAKILTASDILRLLSVARTREGLQGDRDATMIAVSIFAGLRSAEIAALKFNDVTDAQGKIGNVLRVRAEGAKYGKARSVPIRAPLNELLAEWIEIADIKTDYLFRKTDGDRMNANAVQQQIRRIAEHAGLKGVSSHSGRRTYITRLAYNVGNSNCTLVDVQILAGHAGLSSTECYIEPSGAEGALVDNAFSEVTKGMGKAKPREPASEDAFEGFRRGARRSGQSSIYARRSTMRRLRAARENTAEKTATPENGARDPGNSDQAPESGEATTGLHWLSFLERLTRRS